MSMIAYDQFTRGIREKCAEFMTVNELEKTMQTISEQLACFEITQIQTDEGNIGPDVLLETYLDAMRVEGRSERTVAQYRYIIKRLLDRFSIPSIMVSAYHIRKYISDEKARGISDETLRGNRSVFNAYFNWLIREGLISKNPMANIGAIKVPKRIRKAYSDVDIEMLKNYAANAKEKAILLFLDATGCRVSEMTSLDRSSIDLDQMKCTVIGKGNKERTAYFDEVTAAAIRKYLESRTDDCPALFINRFGKRMGNGGVRKILHVIGEKANVANVHPHRFRRTRATKLINRGMPIQEVASILGHENLDTTMTYVVLDQRNVENSYHRYA